MRYLRQLQAGILSYGTAILMIFRSNMWMAFSVPLFLLIGLNWLALILGDDLDAVSFKHIDDSNPDAAGATADGHLDPHGVHAHGQPLHV